MLPFNWLSQLKHRFEGILFSILQFFDIVSLNERLTLILEEKASCWIESRRCDEVKSHYVRVRDDLDTCSSAASLVECRAAVANSHDVHAASVCFVL